MVGLGCLLRDGDPRAAPRMARDSDGYADAGGPDRLRRHPRESVRDSAARVLPFQQRPGRVAVRRSGPADERGRGPRERDGWSRDGDATGGDPGRGVPRRGGRRAVRLRNLLGPEDGPGALRMATDVQLKSQPQRGRVLPAWAYIGWRWVWRSPAAAIVPLLQPFFFLNFLHLIAPESYFPLQVAARRPFSAPHTVRWRPSGSAVFRRQTLGQGKLS